MQSKETKRMSIKLPFEVAHLAQRKTKPAKGGFTHDWELYVRSPNKDADLSNFVEKVVFNLHDTFVKPKRSCKEPPYLVKESGYAAFEVLIEIYLKNRDEPRKFTFNYDLDLQPFKSEIKEFIIDNPSDDFRRKCLKGGCIPISGGGGGKSSSNANANVEYKKPKRPEDSKTNKIFTDLFGAPLEKQQISKNDKNLPGISQNTAATSSSSSSGKDKGEKLSKHKHSAGESKDSKKSGESSRSAGGEKVKKDKTKDRERSSSDKKEKSSKRAPSPTSSSRPNIQNIQNSNLPSSSSLPPQQQQQPPPSSAKNDYSKPTQHTAKPQTPIPEMSSNKKSSKKKNYEKDREKNERKESAKASKEKIESNSSVKKERDAMQSKSDERQKQSMMPVEISKPPPAEPSKKHDSKEADRKHKHKKEKKEKTKDKEIKEKERKEPKVKPQPVKPKPPLSDRDSDSDSDSISMKQEELAPVIIAPKNITPDKPHKKAASSSSRAEKTVKISTEKETDTKKRKRKAKDPSRSPSPSPLKQSKRDYSPMVEKTTKDKNVSLNIAGNVTNEYLDELKDLKQKINTLQTKELHHVVRLIASTGNYEIKNASFDFDLLALKLHDPTTFRKLVGICDGSSS